MDRKEMVKKYFNIEKTTEKGKTEKQQRELAERIKKSIENSILIQSVPVQHQEGQNNIFLESKFKDIQKANLKKFDSSILAKYNLEKVFSSKSKESGLLDIRHNLCCYLKFIIKTKSYSRKLDKYLPALKNSIKWNYDLNTKRRDEIQFKIMLDNLRVIEFKRYILINISEDLAVYKKRKYEADND